MQKREKMNHNDRYVIFFEFEDESDSIDDPVDGENDQALPTGD